MTSGTRVRRASASRPLVLPVGIVSFLITLVGLAVSIYLTVEHYTAATTLACPENSVINCAKVTSSSYSKIGSVPVALLGAIFFAGMAVLCLPAAWRIGRLDVVRIAGAVAGVVSALWFIWVELFRLDAICLWCTVVHVAAFALLGAVLWTTTGLRGTAPTA
jgi:uncharacterized membrane protein